MKKPGALKFLDAKYWGKKLIGNVDIEDAGKKVLPFIKDKTTEILEKYSESKKKLKDIPGTNYELGVYHMQRGNFADAIMRFRMVSYLTPNNVDALYNLGRCLLLSGEIENAKEKFKEVLKKDKNRKDAQYQLEKIEAPEKVKQVPKDIIKEMVDLRAVCYHEDYIEAGYEGPAILISEVLTHITDKNPNMDVLDLGCGTGECGKILRERGVARKITGVDFAAEMVRQTAKRKVNKQKVYDVIEEAEISEFLASTKEKFDLVVANLSFDYFGDLEPIAKSIKSILKNKGHVSFIMRKDENIKTDYFLNLEYEDFSHSDKYIKDVFQKAGFKLLSAKDIEIVGEEQGVVYSFSL